ncbi:MAG: hypothetical protein ACXAC5_00510 [Promethearchaeota archaeon]|jgi:cell division protein FtsL
MSRLNLDPDVFAVLDPVNDLIAELKYRISELEGENAELEKQVYELESRVDELKG